MANARARRQVGGTPLPQKNNAVYCNLGGTPITISAPYNCPLLFLMEPNGRAMGWALCEAVGLGSNKARVQRFYVCSWAGLGQGVCAASYTNRVDCGPPFQLTAPTCCNLGPHHALGRSRSASPEPACKTGTRVGQAEWGLWSTWAGWMCLGPSRPFFLPIGLDFYVAIGLAGYSCNFTRLVTSLQGHSLPCMDLATSCCSRRCRDGRGPRGIEICHIVQYILYSR
jgi:hypothetical protein